MDDLLLKLVRGTWIQNGDEYYVDTLLGRAVITEVRANSWVVGGKRYEARIEHPDGKITKIRHTSDGLEYAKWLLYVQLQRIIESKRGKKELNDLLSTLKLCRSSISVDLDKKHFENIDRIEKLVIQFFTIENSDG